MLFPRCGNRELIPRRYLSCDELRRLSRGNISGRCGSPACLKTVTEARPTRIPQFAHFSFVSLRARLKKTLDSARGFDSIHKVMRRWRVILLAVLCLVALRSEGSRPAFDANFKNELTSVGGTACSYDANGNITGDGIRYYSVSSLMCSSALLYATMIRAASLASFLLDIQRYGAIIRTAPRTM